MSKIEQAMLLTRAIEALRNADTGLSFVAMSITYESGDDVTTLLKEACKARAQLSNLLGECSAKVLEIKKEMKFNEDLGKTI